MEPTKQEKDPAFVRNTVCSIIQIVLAPCFFGVVPLALTILANGAWLRGEEASYKKFNTAVTIFLIVGWVLMAMYVLCIALVVGFCYMLASSGF